MLKCPKNNRYDILKGIKIKICPKQPSDGILLDKILEKDICRNCETVKTDRKRRSESIEPGVSATTRWRSS